MGLLVDGVWQQDGDRTKDGHFVRPTTRFRNWVTPDGSAGPSGEGGFAAEAGRYHLYVSLACPWAHRTIIFRKLKGLENVISMSIVSPDMLKDGWTFNKDEGSTGDDVNGKSKLSEIYLLADPKYTGRVSVPVLWDKKTQDHRQQRVARNHPHVEFGVRCLHQRAHRLLSGSVARRDRPRSTTWSIRTSTTASIAPALPPRRRPTRWRSAACSTRSTRSSRSAVASSAISSATPSPRPTGGCSAR